MASSDMITFLPLKPGVMENSVFGVWKELSVSQRLIWGGYRLNLHFNPDASPVEIPSPDLLCSLLPPGERLYLAWYDISQFKKNCEPRTSYFLSWDFPECVLLQSESSRRQSF